MSGSSIESSTSMFVSNKTLVMLPMSAWSSLCLLPAARCTVHVALSLLAFVTEFGTLAEVLLELTHAIEADAREG